jgi:sorting nexin-1/2
LFYKEAADFTFLQWFDKQRAYLDGLESQLRGLVKSIEVVAKQRAGKPYISMRGGTMIDHISELAVATGEFATAIADLSLSDIGKQLQQSLDAMADVERMTEEFQNIQSQQDIMTLLATGKSTVRIFGQLLIVR